VAYQVRKVLERLGVPVMLIVGQNPEELEHIFVLNRDHSNQFAEAVLREAVDLI